MIWQVSLCMAFLGLGRARSWGPEPSKFISLLDMVIDVSPDGGNGKARVPCADPTRSAPVYCAAFWPGRYRADACRKRLSGLRVSATSPVLADADRHSDCCGVSCPSLCEPSATTPAEPHSLTPPNLASAAPFRQYALLGLHLFQGKKATARGREMEGLRGTLQSQSSLSYPPHTLGHITGPGCPQLL